MQEFKVNRLYKGQISLRSYDVEKWIEANISVKVIVDNEKGYMNLTPEILAHPIEISAEIESKYEGTPNYHLRDYKWIPIIENKEDQALVDRSVMITQLIGDEWFKRIGDLFERPYMKRLTSFLQKERKEANIFPSQKNVFRAFKLCPYDKVKVVICGQDPYHNGAADGLAFSSQGMNTPLSLQTIFKEIKNTESDFNERRLANLQDWTEQGVFLFNTVLTVREGIANSHSEKGWENFSSEVITRLSRHANPLVFVLWGAKAKGFERLIDLNYHLVLKSAHPAAEGYGSGSFLGNGHFTEINNFLKKYYNMKIKW